MQLIGNHQSFPLISVIDRADKLYALRGRLEREEKKAANKERPRSRGERKVVDALVKALGG